MKNYKLTFHYNGLEYEADIESHSAVKLDKTDATIIVEAIIEKQIRYIKGQYVEGLKIIEIESEQR
ncbi:MAG: hypothetical protein IJZ38_08345 [Bacteroides sp.]|nr:hypothetical protein [Bacteroides sp.]